MYTAHPARYDDMPYRRSGRSGLKLPALSLGLWHNFGPDRPAQTQRAILRRAFDLGITHFDLANNYGPPPGAAESALGEFLRTDFAPYRDELVVSTKAGYLMWPGPYGEWGSRKSLLSSLDQSLGRLGLDYVDVFYSHRFDPDTPLEETMGALHSAVQQGKALYVGVSNYSAEQTREAARILGELGTPLTIHQPRYSMLDRRPEDEGLLDALDDLRVGSIAYSPLEQGLLTGRYLDGVPDDSRAASDSPFLNRDALTEDLVTRLRALNDIAASRGQTLAQLALAWVLRGGRVTSALVGASSARQLEDSVAALRNLEFDTEELTLVDTLARP
ncbi:L-glyceraldehyde 3-phosphate reductase [Streptomyces gardneri]|uniref:Glyceraldehyde 3-phosphate reductase n=1 Tax=Streptomyces gardneri TaxID=66892 RepID=A0A4Y3RJ09_9ACTN|nr:L-glyceraldehyde 3-phosphate reductase [Streptomyces gardneri]GEB57359.1 glyceraldehyde 3-phosphate reductase [Streptomyces gardneri]GHH12966.1 glyceraldehyde 3-phosphate reductase [Streptomyces gardneri]